MGAGKQIEIGNAECLSGNLWIGCNRYRCAETV